MFYLIISLLIICETSCTNRNIIIHVALALFARCYRVADTLVIDCDYVGAG